MEYYAAYSQLLIDAVFFAVKYQSGGFRLRNGADCSVELLFLISRFQPVTLKNSQPRAMKNQPKAPKPSFKQTARLYNAAVVAVGKKRGRNTRAVMMTYLRRY